MHTPPSSPSPPPEFARRRFTSPSVFRPIALPGRIDPDPEHLATIRERYGLLGIDADKDDRLLRAAAGWFEPVGRHRVRAPIDADAALTADLIAMGPNAFPGVPEEVAATPTELAVSVWTLRRPRPVG